ncbi:MAG TPA: MoaD/ThiS family protein [Bacillota bacterium]|nr:MoaD/ThiS family protein [Bacillota bacterium]
MKLEIRVFAGLHKYIPGKASGVPFEVEIGSGSTGLQLIEQLGVPEKEAFLFMVNGNRQELSHTLQDGDRVGIFPPVGGG